MVEFDNFSEMPIDISDLIKEVELPIRLTNLLKNSDFYSKDAFFQMIDKLVLEHTSYYLFPNRLIQFYPQIIERRAMKDLTCNLSGAKIKKGSIYYTYHPFMEDLESGRVYTIKNRIRAELGYIDCFPHSLFEYEDWYYRLKNGYHIDNDNSYGIDFYFLSTQCGDNCLNPYLIGKFKKKGVKL